MLNGSIAILASLAIASAPPPTKTKGCVSEAEASAIFAAMLPDMIDGLRDKCAAHLPANAYLVGNGDALVARYKVEADQRWPAAKLAFGKIGGDEEMAKQMPDEFLRPLIGSMVGAELVKDVKPQDCYGASRIVESLAPLPPANVSMLIGAVLTMADKDNSKGSSFPICEAGAG